MSIQRVAVIFDNRARPETTGNYCLSALKTLTQAVHFLPDQLADASSRNFDLFLRVDDGFDYPVPKDLRPLAWWAIDTHLEIDRCVAIGASADLTFVAQKPGVALMHSGGVAADWLPLACDPKVHCRQDCPKRFDFAFVGNVFPGPRAELLSRICHLYPNHFVGQAFFADMARKYSESKTVFNRSIRDDVNMRVFEALACGSLLLTNDLSGSGQEELFRDGSHLATYRVVDELLDKLAFYLGHAASRSRVEESGRQLVINSHTYRHRMERILDAASRLANSYPTQLEGPVSAAMSSSAYGPGYFEFDRPELLAEIPITAEDVLDIGCGAGRLGETLKRRQSVHVIGVEFDARAAAAARERLDEVLEADAESSALNFPDASFDAIICGDVLEHMREPLEFLRRARVWLRPSGRLVASVPNVRHHSIIRSLLAGDWTYEPAGLLDRTHLRFFTRREVEKLFFRAGFTSPVLTPLPGPGHVEWVQGGRPGEVRVGALTIGKLPPSDAEEFFTYQWLATATPSPTSAWGLTSIIIPVFNEVEYTRQCIDSLRLVTDEPYELILVDNGSTDATPKYLHALADSDSRVRVITNATNRGFPAAVNQGIAVAHGRQVLLLNNDTILPTAWLYRLLTVLHSDSKVGLTGPSSNHVSGEQQIDVTYDDLTGLDGFAWELAKTNLDVIEETDRLVGFCLLIRREVIDRVGVLDERFGLGCFEDDDYCARVREAGFRAVIARAAFVHHFGSRTFVASGIDYDRLMRQNQERFRQKWSAPATTPIPNVASPTDKPTESPFILEVAPAGGLLLRPRQPALSACFIVRDNALTIGPCLESIRPWVDEIIVVDTGSTDETPAIAERLGARVSKFRWCDDFSAARNESLRHARGRWIFWMDSDDTIDETNGRGLRQLALGDHAANLFGFVVRVHCPGAGTSGDHELVVVDHVKLIRNRPDLRFDGRIHEQILPAIRHAGGEVAWSDLFVVHSGYDHTAEGQERKLRRDLRLLHLELAERPDHPFTLFNLGMTYGDVGRFREAADYLERSLKHASPDATHLRKVYALLVHCRLEMGQFEQALEVCRRGLDLFPEDLELQFRLGNILHQTGRLRESVTAYERVLESNRSRYFASVDPGIAGFKAWQNLAVVWTELGERAQAEAAWRQVVADAPTYRLGWRGLAMLLLEQRRFDEVERMAAHLDAIPITSGEGAYLLGRIAAAHGQSDRARRHWEIAAARLHEDAEPCRSLAQLLFDLQEDTVAETMLIEVTRRDPTDPSAFHNLGLVYLRTDRPSEATEAFKQSLQLRPQSAETHLGLGYARRQLQDRDGAIEAWTDALRVDPGNMEAASAIRAAVS